MPRDAADHPLPPSAAALATARAAAKSAIAARAQATGTLPGSGSRPSRRLEGNRTVSQATIDHYVRRGRLLVNRYRRGTGSVNPDGEIDPVDFANWLLSLKPTYKSNTWRLYRQAALLWLDGFPGDRGERAVSMLDADTTRGPARETGDPDEDGEASKGKRPRRTSGLKEKRFPEEDLERVTCYLRFFSRSKLAGSLADWLQATILTGLRPVEWLATDLQMRDDPSAPHGRRVYLYALNAKATNGRGTGVARTLDLSGLDDGDIELVRRTVLLARGWSHAGRSNDIQVQLAGVLYATTTKLWPTRRQHYSLYSCRHQAIANWKTVLSIEELAAIVGHGSSGTASSHYGKRRSAWPPERIKAPPRAVPEELSLVRDRIRFWSTRIRNEQLAGLRRADDNPEFPLNIDD